MAIEGRERTLVSQETAIAEQAGWGERNISPREAIFENFGGDARGVSNVLASNRFKNLLSPRFVVDDSHLPPETSRSGISRLLVIPAAAAALLIKFGPDHGMVGLHNTAYDYLVGAIATQAFLSGFATTRGGVDLISGGGLMSAIGTTAGAYVAYDSWPAISMDWNINHWTTDWPIALNQLAFIGGAGIGTVLGLQKRH